MKKLGFGLMRLPQLEDGSVDVELTKRMVDEYLKRGFTYFDTAWMYCNGTSENVVKEAIMERYPRDAFTLTTKLPAYMLKTEADRDKIFNEQRRKTGAEFFDYYLLHDVNSGTLKTFDKLNCFDWIRQKKEQGLIKTMGFSYHDGPELLDEILTKHPDMEIVQLQINYLDWESESVQSRKCYEVARKHGKKVLIMEPVKGGTLANVPASVEEMFKAHDPSMSVASWAVRFAAGLDGVMMVLSGMSNMEQMLDNLSYMEDYKPLTEDEINMVHVAADMINGNITVPCTGCEYCIVNCPMNINIPKCFALYNADKRESAGRDWTAQVGYYNTMLNTSGNPADCVKCGACEAMCPQHLHIRDYLEDVAAHFAGRG